MVSDPGAYPGAGGRLRARPTRRDIRVQPLSRRSRRTAPRRCRTRRCWTGA